MGNTAKMVKELRETTGAGMMDCKKALSECDGDMEKAGEYLRKKGIASASKKEGRTTSQGIVGSYIHMGGKVGVLIEVACGKEETQTADAFAELVKDLTLHIAAAAPPYLTSAEIPEDVIAEERAIFAKQVEGKPEQIIDKIVDGKVKKFFGETCLINQGFVKEPKQSITELLAEKGKELGDTLEIKRFARYQLGV